MSSKIPDEQVIEMADMMLEFNLTIRDLAKVYKLSKSYIYTLLTKRLSHLDGNRLYKCWALMKEHRHNHPHLKGESL